MRIEVLYFASLKESLGLSNETVTLPASVTTTGALRDWLADVGGRTALRTATNLRCARNQEMVGLSESLADGDEIAFFPPVTGG